MLCVTVFLVFDLTLALTSHFLSTVSYGRKMFISLTSGTVIFFFLQVGKSLVLKKGSARCQSYKTFFLHADAAEK
jgi:hypothetical protein